jgi:dTDP-4-amino-4,6-dideoxygalactose transaminase
MTAAAQPSVLVPFNKAAFSGLERDYLYQALDSGRVAGDGPFTKKCELYLEQRLGVPRVLLTTSCTDALEMCALLLDISPGDEVILPSFTFVSTANAFALRGAALVFADVRPDTLNLDERTLEALVTPRTRAIVVVHYAGVACEMDTIMEVARRHDIAVVEDNAHGLFATYRGKLLGTFGALATQSFHETKNITCGEGGALLINDPALVARAEILREKGTNRASFFRGQVDKYGWVDIGSSFLPSELNAAVLLGQLEQSDQIQTRRQQIWMAYQARLAGWAVENGVTLPHVPDDAVQPWHMFYMLFPDLVERTRFLAEMRAAGVSSVFHYLPLHRSTMGERFAARPVECPVTDSISDRLVRLPFYSTLDAVLQERVIQAVLAFRCGASPFEPAGNV